jgi:hypothetical protein
VIGYAVGAAFGVFFTRAPAAEPGAAVTTSSP